MRCQQELNHTQNDYDKGKNLKCKNKAKYYLVPSEDIHDPDCALCGVHLNSLLDYAQKRNIRLYYNVLKGK